MEKRLDWDSYFMALAHQVKGRSTCLRRKVGAVAVNPRHRIIGTGYNGPPAGMKHCEKDTCIRTVRDIPSGTQLDLCKAIHAEANIVLQLGQELEGASVYVTCQPCASCLKLLMGAAVDRIIWESPYNDDYSRQLMSEYGNLEKIEIENEAGDRTVAMMLSRDL